MLPGSVKTDRWGKTSDSAQQTLTHENSVYEKYLRKASTFSSAYEISGVSAAQVAVVLKKALEDRTPALNYLIGTDAKIANLMVKFLPDSWRHWLIRRQLGF